MNTNSEKPIFLQIVDIIEDEIISENLKVDDRAPSTNEFSNIYKINPATARKGLTILADDGVLYKKRGMGMFVTKDAKKIILEKRKEEFLSNLIPEILREAKKLEIDRDKLIKIIQEAEE